MKKENWQGHSTLNHVVSIDIELLKRIQGHQHDARVGVNRLAGVSGPNSVQHRWLMQVTQLCQIIHILQHISAARRRRKKTRSSEHHTKKKQGQRKDLYGLSSGGKFDRSLFTKIARDSYSTKDRQAS